MKQKSNKIDLLIKNGRIFTMDDEERVIDSGVIGIKDDEIKFIEKSDKFTSRKNIEIEREIDAGGKIIFPGLINTHSHAYQILLKGLGADLALMDWVMAVVAPYSQKITREINYYAAQLMALESLQCGCTTTSDFFYAHHQPELSDGVIEGLRDTGIRGLMVRNFHDCGVENGIPESYLETPDEAFQDVKRLIDKYEQKSEGMLRIWTGPGVTWGISKEGLEATVEFSEAEGIPYSSHILETEDDNQHIQKQYGKSAVELMDEVGFLNPNLLAAHCVKLTEEECKIFGDRGVNVAYNAVSNMYLGSGIPPIVELKEAGARITLGTDGAASNNSMDMIETMKTSALLQKVAHEAPEIISAQEILKMATSEAAAALQWEDEIGSLKEGKKADLFIFNPEDPKAFPAHDPVATLVYSSSLKNVETTIVNGNILYHQGEFKNEIDRNQIFSDLKKAVAQLVE